MTVQAIGVIGPAPILIQQDGQAVQTFFATGGGGGDVARVITPNAEGIFAAAFAPGDGAILAAFDITPIASGLLLVSVNVTIEFAGETEDEPGLLLEYVDELTAITGGTLYAPGITSVPTSTTPADNSGTAVFAVSGRTQLVSGNEVLCLSMASVPVQAVVGHRTLIAIRAESQLPATWDVVGLAASVIEQP